MAAIPDPNMIADSEHSSADIFLHKASWFGVLKYLGYLLISLFIYSYEVETKIGETDPLNCVSTTSTTSEQIVFYHFLIFFIYTSIDLNLQLIF